MRILEPVKAPLLPLALLAASLHAAEPTVFELSGRVCDAGGQPLAGAAIQLDETVAARSDADGRYRVRVEAGERRLRISLEGYQLVSRSLVIDSDRDDADVVLQPQHRFADEVVVQAIRADAGVPVTKTDVDAPELKALNHGQEMPFLLQQGPSLTQYSENGSTSGYSYLYLRGIHQTRINMTLDGVPLNDPEESAVYFSNFGDFASALESIQVQRGVGTSSVGAASFGGSINFASADIRSEPELAAEVGLGSFGSGRATVGAHSGRFGPGIALYARGSYQTTDGFRERSGVAQHTLFFGASRQDGASFLKLFGFTGRERTQLSFLATEQSLLERDLRFNSLAEEERDRFGQDLLHVQYTRFFGTTRTLAGQVYYNGAQGWFRLWADPETRGSLLQFGLDGRALGGQLTYSEARGRGHLTAGLHGYDFHRDHVLDVVGGSRAYLNTGLKGELSAFAKLGWDPGRWQLYLDAQVRHARFRYRGAVPLDPVSWTFVNPKFGLRYEASSHLSVYGSLGRAKREPTRNDLLAGEDDASVAHDLRAVRPEQLLDLEAGLAVHTRTLALEADVYAMEFRNEIAATGELSDLGLLLRRNVERSQRRGLELDASYRPLPSLRLRLTATLSRNRIRTWTQFYDVYDVAGALLGSEARTYQDVEPLLTPPLILNQSIDWWPGRSFSLGLLGRYVSRSWLDNTNQLDLRTPAFFTLDACAALSLGGQAKLGRPRLRLLVRNLLDNRRVFPSGYSFVSLARDAAGRETLAGSAYYYPLATRSAFLSLDVRF
jgi:iron complex outermembrane receptor protein